MIFRSRISLLLALSLSLLVTIPAFAGGWAVITLDELPSGVAAGEPLTIGFTVRQHGRTMMSGLTPKITAILGEEKLTFFAESEGEPGHYAATLTFPKEGDWKWAVEAFTMVQPMPALTVGAPEAAVNPLTKETASVTMLTAFMVPVSLAVLVLGLFAAVIGFRRKSRSLMVLTALCFLAGFSLLVVGRTGAGSGVAVQAKSGLTSDSSLSQVELGRQLFLAKGCITCHNNSRATRSSEYMTIGMGAPDLSKFSASAEALRMRLKGPLLGEIGYHDAEFGTERIRNRGLDRLY